MVKDSQKSKLAKELLSFSMDEILKDYEKFYEVHKGIEKDLENLLIDNKVSVVYRDEKPVGYMAYREEGNMIRLLFWAVKPECRGKNMHWSILDEILKEARSKNKKYVYGRVNMMESGLIMSAIRRGWIFIPDGTEALLVQVLRRD